jgi:hypothetical protein
MHGGDLLFVRDASGGSVQVFETLAHEAVNPGDEVEVSGFPSLGDYSAVMRDSPWATQSGPLPAPGARTARISSAQCTWNRRRPRR